MKKALVYLIVCLITGSAAFAQSSNVKYLNSDEWKKISSKFIEIRDHNEAIKSTNRSKIKEIVPAPIDHSVAMLLGSTETAGKFNEILENSGLKPYFESAGPFTMVVPNDAAISALSEKDLDALFVKKDKTVLRAFVLDHVFPGKLIRQELSTGLQFRSFSDEKTSFEEDGDTMFAIVNMSAKNGIIHVIDRTLVD
ncbi:MAG: fasciclin domain-containing protein [Bacteroidia bacterium]|nr:fasciclin domain-containing protein [Bacteroidia bacterium]